MSDHKPTACEIEAVGTDKYGLPDLRVTGCPNRKVAPTVDQCLACAAVKGLEGNHGVASSIVCTPEEADAAPEECVPSAPCLPKPTPALPTAETQIIRVRKSG